MIDGSLAEAFGEHPDRTWVAAVTWGGLGYYGAAARLLAQIMATAAPGGPGLGLRHARAATTRASHLRQGGRHDLALALDGQALRLLADLLSHGPARQIPADELVSARVDALVGAAADNLGLRRFDVTDRLLDRADALLAGAVHAADGDGTWHWVPRSRLRCGWVHTETALYRGDASGAALALTAPLAAAQRCPSARHRLKTDLIAAAVAAADGQVDSARARARDCAQRAAQLGQMPLQWAAETMLCGLGGDAAAADRAEELRRELIVRGGAFE
ncbi:hypothetical protein [Williamsia sp. CHRR-6]|uniref:hypothetical protein n=1 Tax=Williamsia sp. CHRR-6 TaxID=2835871 RepID=UPI001BD9CE93|nr:hypothetical protein [Williamsia sp. CHRR-6]MBT0566757.1 hypothetical protein [Williamsia sp. CHRR-6]